MPVCFQLFKKGSTEPEVFQDIDVEICNHFGVEVDDVKWYCDWYDCIGVLLATGRTFQQVKEVHHSWKELCKVVDFLEDNYTTRSWRESCLEY